MVRILHTTLFEIRRDTNIVVRAEDQTRSFPRQELSNCLYLFGRSFLFGNHVIESEYHQSVGIRKNPFVQRQSLSSLVNPLIDRDWMFSDLTYQRLELQQ